MDSERENFEIKLDYCSLFSNYNLMGVFFTFS